MKPLTVGIKEAGKLLGGLERPLSRATIYRMIERGDLEALKLGQRTQVTTTSIDRCLSSAKRLRSKPSGASESPFDFQAPADGEG